ncbi:hypothetical protein BC834DRAFT_1041002 [Gloeopeniophorella convolvens]|nr:hypothetical protein BC834DRAFT_1041002 [Gloeopeniophorella convolvens]
MPLPAVLNGGLSLQGPARMGDALQPLSKRAMIIRMSEATLEALAAFPSHPPLQLEFGDTPGIHIGASFFPMSGVQESTPHELYLRSAPANKTNAPLKLYADIAGKYTVGRELNGKTESKVHQSTADAQKAKSGGRIVVLDAPPALAPPTKSKPAAGPKKRKDATSGTTVKRVPQLIQAKNEGSAATRARSPLPPAAASAPPASQGNLVSQTMRSQMVHLLARGPRSKEDVLTQVGGPDASNALQTQLNELMVTIAERERKPKAAGQPALYALLPEFWKEVRPYEYPGLADDERRRMWLQARRTLHGLGIAESDPAWDHVRTRPGSTATATAPKAGAGQKRGLGAAAAERKKPAVGTSKAPIEAKDEGTRPSSRVDRLREDAALPPRPKPVAKRDEDMPLAALRRPPPASGAKASPMSTPSQSQGPGPSKNAALLDARAKRDEPSKTNGRPNGAPPIQASSSRDRDRDRPLPPSRKQREDESDLDREKGKSAAAPKARKRRDDASDLESLRDWDGAEGKPGLKKRKLRDDYDDKDRPNGAAATTNNPKRRKIDEDAPYKPGGAGTAKVRERERDRDRDRESDRPREKERERERERDSLAVPKQRAPRDNDREPSPLPRRLVARDRAPERERERDRDARQRDRDRSASPPPRRTKRDPTPLSRAQRDVSPPLRSPTKRSKSPPPPPPPREPPKRELSPRPRARRDESPLPPPQRKRERDESPPARKRERERERSVSPVPPPRGVVRARERERERDREASVNSASTARRRRSPVFTSSEDEPRSRPHAPAPPRRTAPSSVTSSSSRGAAAAAAPPAPPPAPLPPAVPLPRDRAGLEARYRKGYRAYIAVYHQLSEERGRIEDALAELGTDGEEEDGRWRRRGRG